MNLYRVLLLAFPRDLRREFGDEMSRMFAAQLREARTERRSVVGLWCLAAADAVGEGCGERWTRIRQRWRPRGVAMGRWRWWMRAFGQDLRYAARLFAVQRSATVIAILTLALGIGANTAIFSAVYALLLRPLPYPNPGQLAMIWEKRPVEGVFDNVVAPADFADWERMNTTFSAMAAMGTVSADLTGTGEPVRVVAGAASTAFFEVLGVQPALGRGFVPDDGVVGQHRVVVLDYPIWRNRFASDPSIVGRTISLNGIPYEVIGVLPEVFAFPDSKIELWAPMPFRGLTTPPTRAVHSYFVYARMKAGVTLGEARADMDRVGALLSEQYPETNRVHGAWVVPLADELKRPVRSGLLLLFGAVGFVLLIACVNVANLSLARASARRREFAMRTAIGASRARIAGQMITESVLLSVVGGAAGLIVAHWGIRTIRSLAPANVPLLGIDAIALDPTVLLFTLALSVATGVLFGVLPAWHVATQDVNLSLRDSSRTGGLVRRRMRLALVVSEIALASALLVCAGLTLRSFQKLLDTDSGFHAGNVLTSNIVLPNARYNTPEKRLAALDDLEQRFARIPGVKSVGMTSHLPLSGQNSRNGIMIDGYNPPPDTPTRAHIRSISAGYFRTMGMDLVSGRSFAPLDRENAPFVAIVNETFARIFSAGSSPIGRRVQLNGTDVWREIVGVVRDVRHWGLDSPVNPELYMPHRQYPWAAMNFVIAADGDPGRITATVREQLRAVDPDLPLARLTPMSEVTSRSVAARRSSLTLLAIFGALALTLAAAGIYGVMTHLVALRTGEIGVRMTLGARPASVMSLIFREGLAQAAIGLVIGVTGGVLLMRTFRSMLYGIGPEDPLTLIAVSIVLLATAALSCAVPARRAMRVDPVEALRQ